MCALDCRSASVTSPSKGADAASSFVDASLSSICSALLSCDSGSLVDLRLLVAEVVGDVVPPEDTASSLVELTLGSAVTDV